MARNGQDGSEKGESTTALWSRQDRRGQSHAVSGISRRWCDGSDLLCRRSARRPMDCANLPARGRSRQHGELRTCTADWLALKGAVDLRRGRHPGNVAVEHHPQRAGRRCHGCREPNIGWQVLRPVLCSGFEGSGFQDDCIVGQESECGRGVATSQSLVKPLHRFANGDGVGDRCLRQRGAGCATESASADDEKCGRAHPDSRGGRLGPIGYGCDDGDFNPHRCHALLEQGSSTATRDDATLR